MPEQYFALAYFAITLYLYTFNFDLSTTLPQVQEGFTRETMPLAFHSLNRGDIAFGFFNIDTDLLLLDHYFLFADDFCSYITRLAQLEGPDSYETLWEVYDIPRRTDIGDLMGAIHGVRHIGFIGDVYRLFPFPQRQADFKQKPEGFQSRPAVKPILERYAAHAKILFRTDIEHGTVAIGEYLFIKEVFRQLIEYVWLGGYPRWREGTRPEYVMKMKRSSEASSYWLFSD